MKKGQSIKRSELKLIHDSVCDNWKTKIKDLILWNDDSNIVVSDEMILQGYSEANAEQKKLIEKYFKIEIPKKITEKVKNFNDILDIAGLTMEEVVPYKNAKTKKQKSVNAYAKLQLVGEVLNGETEESWIDWKTNSQYKYYPYFEYKAQGGWGCYCYRYPYCSSDAEAAYFKTSELAVFAGKTFIEEYKEFLNR